jgi:phenylacetate-CoA ligase
MTERPTYGWLFKQVLEPCFERLKGRSILDHRAQLERSQWWSADRLEAHQWDNLTALLQHAYEQTPYWRRTMDRVGLPPSRIRSWEDFRRLPLISREEIQGNVDAMCAADHRGKTWPKSTGGSSGTPLHFHYTPESYEWRAATTKRGYGWAGYEDGLRSLHIWGVALGEVSAYQRYKEMLHRTILRQRYINCFDWGPDAMRRAFEEIRRFQPEVIVAFTNPLYELAKFLQQEGRKPPPIHSIVTGAEKLHEHQRAVIHAAFGCPVFNTYGSREFMLIASECTEHSGLHIQMENLVVEVVTEQGQPVKPGETGEIVVTDLHNLGMPFIRYRIGDLGIPSDRDCPCGRKLRLLEDVVGRSLDMLVTAEGRMVPGEFFPHLMKDHEQIRQFQVIQNEPDLLEIRFVRSDRQAEVELEPVRHEIQTVMGQGTRIRFEEVAEIPLTRLGKLRVTINNIPRQQGRAW